MNIYSFSTYVSLGKPASLGEVKACLKTVEGVRWTMAKEGKRNTVVRGKPVVSDPTGLF